MELRMSRPNLQNLLLLTLLAVLLALLVLTLNGEPAPEINTEFEGATIHILAAKGWSLIPGDCLEIRWQVEGIKSIYINDVGKIGWGEMMYCPTLGAAGPEFRITAQNGVVRGITLDLHFRPIELLICLMFVAIVALFGLAGYFFVRFQLDKPPPLTWSTVILFAIAVVICLLGSASDIFSIRQLLQVVGQVFGSPAWQLFGVVLGAAVFVPLVMQSVQRGIQRKSLKDFVAVAAFFGFLLLLYLPFGFESVGHYEEWVYRAYLEGRPSKASVELVSRFWILVPTTLASLISPDSFAGFHLVNFLMFWGKMALLYGVLRQLKFSPFIAFLCTVLFLVYPVNSALMSLRSFQMTFSKLSMLAAVYLALDYRANPARLKLLGIWLALLFNVGSYEIGYAIVLIVPLLWWRRPQWEWQRLNLTINWYIFPAAKVAYLILLTAADQLYYASRVVSANLESERFTLDSIGYYLDIVGKVYRQTFATGWREALNAMSHNAWILPTIAALIVTGIAAVYLARDSEAGDLPTRRQSGIALLCGTVFILPSIGVLMWLERYNQDLWRMYVYVPIGAAVAVICLLLLISSLIKNIAFRKLAIVGASLLLMIPATSRLFVQHDHFVSSATPKAKILKQIVEQAPAINQDAYVILLTDMTGSELRSHGISELRTNMLDSAIFMLYDGQGPEITFLCMTGVRCHLDDIALKQFSLGQATDFSKLALFRLHDDLSVELLRELPPELGIDDTHNYDPDRLIDASAPLPPRAITMLGASTD